MSSPWRRRFHLSAQNPLSVTRNLHAVVQERPVFDMHYELEVGIVCQGVMRRFVGEDRSERRPGQAWLCGMWEPHGCEVIAAPCEVLVLVLWPPLLASALFPQAPGLSLLAPFTLPPPMRPGSAPGQSAALLDLAQRLSTCAAEPPTAAGGVLLQLLAFELLVRLQSAAADTLASPGRAAFAAYTRLCPAIDRALTTRLPVGTTEGARLCGLGIRQFTRQFHDLMGLSFAKFALRHRLRGAADDLAGTDQPTKSVAEEWGFVDASHLHRLFSAHYGCSPTAYRSHWDASRVPEDATAARLPGVVALDSSAAPGTRPTAASGRSFV